MPRRAAVIPWVLALARAEAHRTRAKIRQRTAAEDLRRRFPGLPLSEPSSIAEPSPIIGSETEWLATILQESHELGIARGESQFAQVTANRSSRDQLPYPTIGMHFSRERGGEENVVGAYISIPPPGDGRRATSDASLARASAANYREAAARQKIEAEAATLPIAEVVGRSEELEDRLGWTWGALGGACGGQCRSGLGVNDTVKEASGATQRTRFVNIAELAPDASLRGVRVFEFDRDLRLVEILIGAGADPSRVNNSGTTPIALAATASEPIRRLMNSVRSRHWRYSRSTSQSINSLV